MAPSSNHVVIYDRNTIRQLCSESVARSSGSLRYLRPLIENSPATYMDNVVAEMKLLVVNGTLVPFTINNTQGGTTINGRPAEPWHMAPQNDDERW